VRIAAAAVVLLFARSAFAEEPSAPDDPWRARPISLAGQMIATPYGFAGASVAVTPVRWLSVEAGGGVTVDGPQAALMPRGRIFVSRKVALSLGLGASFGRYVDAHDLQLCAIVPFGARCPPDPVRTWETAAWANALGALEGRTGSGFEWRVFAGIGRLLNRGAFVCDGGSCPDAAPTQPYAGLALGYAFGL
jgi:hypothetical protein